MRYTRRDLSERALEMVEGALDGIRKGKIAVPFQVEELLRFQAPEI